MKKLIQGTEKLKRNIFGGFLGGLFDEDTLLNIVTFEFRSVVSRNPETLVAAKRYALFHNDLEIILKQKSLTEI